MGAAAVPARDPVPLNATLAVHVVPRAARSEVAGMHGDAIKVRVAAPPVDGAANDELVRFLARRLRVPASAVVITGGAGARRKTVTVSGLTHAAATAALLGRSA